MAVTSMRELTVHPGARSFRLGFGEDTEADRELYDAGVALENAPVEEGSAANIVLERLATAQSAPTPTCAATPMPKAAADQLR